MDTSDPTVPIVDGFLYDLTLQQWGRDYRASVLGQLETHRRAASYRVRWIVVPDDSFELLLPYDTVEYQARITPGSYLWGVSVAMRNAAGAVITPPVNMLVRITEGATKIPLYDDFISAASFDLQGVPQMLSQPRLILEPGYVQVEVANADPVNNITQAQVLLWTMEPCLILNEIQLRECPPFGGAAKPNGGIL